MGGYDGFSERMAAAYSRDYILSEDDIKITRGRVRMVQCIPDSLDPSWQESYEDKYLKHSYYLLLQDTLGEQFDHYFLILEKNDGKAYVQPVFLVRQNILEGLPVSVKGLGAWIPRWLSSLCEFRTLMVGCSAGEGTLAGRECDHNEVSRVLCDILPEAARQLKASLIVLKDFPSSYLY